MNQSHILRLSGIMIMLTGVLALGIPALPSVMAFPDPSQGTNLAKIVKGTTVEIQISRGVAPTPVDGDFIRVYKTDKNSIGLAPPCPPPSPQTVGVTVWQLFADANGNQRIDYHFPAGSAATTTLRVDFGTNAANPVKITIDAPGEITIGGVNQGQGPINGYWLEITGANPGIPQVGTNANTDMVGAMAIASCGLEGTNTPRDAYEGGATFNVIEPVGGTVLPINNASLLIAGFSANPIWILPILGTIAAGTFAILKFQVQRRT